MLNYLTFNETKIQRFSLKDCLQIPHYRPSERPPSTPLLVGLPSAYQVGWVAPQRTRVRSCDPDLPLSIVLGNVLNTSL